MKTLQRSQLLTIGDVAERLGVSVRALRLYEQEGLVAPKRTEAGQRAFSKDDLARLQQILTLKKTGCTLEQIRNISARGLIDPTALLNLQIEALQDQKSVVDRTLSILKAARDRLRGGDRIGLTEFCDLIKLGESAMTENAWKQVWDRYYTPEEQEQWRSAKQQFSASDVAKAEKAWSDLIDRINSAIARGIMPEEDTAIALAKEWYELQKPLVEKIGVETWNKSQKMYEQMNEWQSNEVKSPFSKEVYSFILKAAEAGRDRGVIPPRATSG